MEAMEEGARLAGDLEGLAVTGLSMEGIELLQHYIDNTGDVQTAALVMAHVVPSRFHDARVSHWVNMCVLSHCLPPPIISLSLLWLSLSLSSPISLSLSVTHSLLLGLAWYLYRSSLSLSPATVAAATSSRLFLSAEV